MDFTLSTYKHLLNALQVGEYSFQTFADFINDPLDRVVVMRHDVDKLPGNALRMAELEQEMEIQATYYFRAVDESFDRGIMEEMAGMGHEIGYHYESVDQSISESVSQSDKGNLKRRCLNFSRKNSLSEDEKDHLIDQAYEDFCRNLAMFRENFDVKTVCMHGSPLSKFDNRMIWEKYDYRELGIVAEPYFDVDFSQVFYITDTGRKWNRESSSVRDKVESGFDIEVKSTKHLIELARGKRTEDRGRRTEDRGRRTEDIGRRTERVTRERKIELPGRIMINVHPQRWHDRPLPWMKELVGQNVKNVAKKMLIRFR